MGFFETLPAFLAAHEVAAYFALFGLSFAETLIGIGFFIYGELIFLPAAALAGAGVLDITLVAVSLILGGILGDATSYFLGARYGTWFLARFKGNWARMVEEKGTHFFHKYGAKAVFFARFLGPVSWVTPFFAGMHRMHFGTYLAFNIPGVICGIGQFLIIGYFFGAAYDMLLPELKVYGNAAIILLVVVTAIFYTFKYFKDRRAAK